MGAAVQLSLSASALKVRRIESVEALPLREIRLAALADSPSAFRTTHAEMVDRPMAFWADRVISNSTGDDSAVFIAETGGTWIGMVAAHRPESLQPLVELVSMWVSASGRRTGAGRALVEAVTTWASDIGFPAVELWVIADNTTATGFYRACGFRIIDDYEGHPDDPCINEIRMTKVAPPGT
jgi:GNAT superfamily N-acetyltransferase